MANSAAHGDGEVRSGTEIGGGGAVPVMRETLPIPDVKHVGLTTYDAKDPDTSFPPIEPLRPPAGAPNVLDRPDRRRRLRRLERVRRAVRDADRRAARGERAEVQPLPHDRAVLADARSAAHRPQPPLGRAWAAITEIATSAPGLQLGAPEHRGAARRDAQAQRLLDGAVRQVPRGAGLGDEPDGPVRPAGRPAAGFEHFYGFIGGETNQYYPAHLRGHDADRADRDPGGGLPLHRGHDRPGDRLDPPAEGADARQAVLHLLRARAPRTRRTTSPPEWSDKYKGKFDQGWDALREETFARQKELGVIPPTPS